MLAAITLLPAMLGLLRHRINSGRVTGNTGAPATDTGAWHRWAELVSRHPWIAIVAALAVLLVLAIPTLSLDLGQTDDAAAAKGTRDPRVVRRDHGRLRRRAQRAAAGRRRPLEGRDERPGPAPDLQPAADAAATGRPGRHDAGAQPAGPGERAAAEDLPGVHSVRPPAREPARRDRQDGGRAVGHAGQRQRRRHRGRLPRDLEEHAVLRRDGHPRRHPARQRAAGRHQGPGHDRLRGRLDGQLHRPRGPDQRSAAAGHRPRPAALVRAAHDRLPLAARAAQGRRAQRPLDRRGVRRRQLRLHATTRRPSSSGSTAPSRSSRTSR